MAVVEKAMKVKSIVDDVIRIQIDQDVYTKSIAELVAAPSDPLATMFDNLKTALRLENIDGTDSVKLKEAIERRTFKTHVSE